MAGAISAEVVVALHLSPGDGRGGHESAGIALVFMGEENVVAGAHQASAVAGLGRQPLGVGRALPLLDKALAMVADSVLTR